MYALLIGYKISEQDFVPLYRRVLVIDESILSKVASSNYLSWGWGWGEGALMLFKHLFSENIHLSGTVTGRTLVLLALLFVHIFDKRPKSHNQIKKTSSHPHFACYVSTPFALIIIPHVTRVTISRASIARVCPCTATDSEVRMPLGKNCRESHCCWITVSRNQVPGEHHPYCPTYSYLSIISIDMVRHITKCDHDIRSTIHSKPIRRTRYT
jgi:hypothetical protein